MVYHQSLRDAAISLSTILEAHNVRHAFFGGFAIIERCGLAYRESKDIDCLVSKSKDEVIKILDGRAEWMVIPQAREDYVAFFWKNPHTQAEQRELVLVELFVGIKHSHIPRTKLHSILSPTFGAAAVPMLSEEFLFRGKINACATRNKSSDLVDILFLIATFPRQVRSGAKKLDKRVIGAALARHPHLQMIFQRVGVPVNPKLIGCPETVQQAGRIMEGEVHRGLGCAW